MARRPIALLALLLCWGGAVQTIPCGPGIPQTIPITTRYQPTPSLRLVTDLNADPQAAAAFEVLISEGIYPVPPTSTVRPAATITRGLTAILLVNALRPQAALHLLKETRRRTDSVPVQVMIALQLGWFPPDSRGAAGQERTVSRAEFVLAVRRALELEQGAPIPLPSPSWLTHPDRPVTHGEAARLVLGVLRHFKPGRTTPRCS